MASFLTYTRDEIAPLRGGHVEAHVFGTDGRIRAHGRSRGFRIEEGEKSCGGFSQKFDEFFEVDREFQPTPVLAVLSHFTFGGQACILLQSKGKNAFQSCLGRGSEYFSAFQVPAARHLVGKAAPHEHAWCLPTTTQDASPFGGVDQTPGPRMAGQRCVSVSVIGGGPDLSSGPGQVRTILRTDRSSRISIGEIAAGLPGIILRTAGVPAWKPHAAQPNLVPSGWMVGLGERNNGLPTGGRSSGSGQEPRWGRVGHFIFLERRWLCSGRLSPIPMREWAGGRAGIVLARPRKCTSE